MFDVRVMWMTDIDVVKKRLLTELGCDETLEKIKRFVRHKTGKDLGLYFYDRETAEKIPISRDKTAAELHEELSLQEDVIELIALDESKPKRRIVEELNDDYCLDFLLY